MKEWIEENLDPPGNERKNWRSIFSFIGRVFGIVKDDAIKAHNAFFPYLCDSDKLRQHGESLMIPELPFDTEKEYRDRVTTASFYLMRAGERTYIHEQLQAHFGDTYSLKEDFLQVFIEILDLSDEGRTWVYSFLDGILDPAISFTVTNLIKTEAVLFAAQIPWVKGRIDVLSTEDDSVIFHAALPQVNYSIEILFDEEGYDGAISEG